LDEIGELPLSLQVKLLRVLQDEEITPLGATGVRKVDVRVIAATARDLGDEIKEGRFREALYYRINVVTIYLPPLRERLEDIPLLVEHFLALFNERLKRDIKGISPAAMERCMIYLWPGNVRELENVIERAVLLAPGDTLGLSDLPPALREEELRPLSEILPKGISSIKKATRMIEQQLIERALERSNGNRTQAAKILEISHRALLYKLKEHGLGQTRPGNENYEKIAES